MREFQIYEHGRVLVAWIRAESHAEAAAKHFAANPKINLIDVGRKGTSPEWRFRREGTPEKLRQR